MAAERSAADHKAREDANRALTLIDQHMKDCDRRAAEVTRHMERGFADLGHKLEAMQQAHQAEVGALHGRVNKSTGARNRLVVTGLGAVILILLGALGWALDRLAQFGAG